MGNIGEELREFSPEERALKDAYEAAKKNLDEVRKHHSKHSKPVARAKGMVRVARIALLNYRRTHGIQEFAFRGKRETRKKHEGKKGEGDT